MIEQHFQKCITVPSKDKIKAIFWGSDELYEIMQRKIVSYLKSEYALQGPNDFDFVKVTWKKTSVLSLAGGDWVQKQCCNETNRTRVSLHSDAVRSVWLAWPGFTFVSLAISNQYLHMSWSDSGMPVTYSK